MPKNADKFRHCPGLLLCLCIALTACAEPDVPADGVLTATNGEAEFGQIDDERILNHADDPDNWLAHGRDYSEKRFSPLSEINKSNVSGLGLAWALDMGTNRAQEATPIVVDDTLFSHQRLEPRVRH